MKFISFYYDKPGCRYYTTCYKRLQEQLNFLQLDYDIEPVLFSESNYQNITLSKPSFILKKINELKQPVLWIDIDCYFAKPIHDFSFLVGDVGFFIREHDNKTPHAAMIYFDYNDSAISFIESWNNKCKNFINDPTYTGGDHCQLIETFNEFDGKLKSLKIYQICSVNQNTPIRIGISQGGVDVELNKK